uniref:Uncharacterized protein n=1 Tax=Eutreptiella gymnastica TaxID=73025 RepID=A0A7S1NPT8_9EUGL|mmetsp:Transcript_73025/g.128671  ORF Transcript_73025/g.128671 Transcript_73025/m.128671 type:complete len:109 (+) Transcript_73025:169-495(+)
MHSVDNPVIFPSLAGDTSSHPTPSIQPPWRPCGTEGVENECQWTAPQLSMRPKGGWHPLAQRISLLQLRWELMHRPALFGPPMRPKDKATVDEGSEGQSIQAAANGPE